MRNEQAFLDFFFAQKGADATDRLFLHLPKEVRAPIVAGWRIRGLKAALRDDDERVKAVVSDALEAGDVDAKMFEDGVAPETLIDWVPLDAWWAFWRGVSVPNAAVQRALASARALNLVDDQWFFENVSARAGKLKGTDAICDALSKDDLTSWLRAIHASGDASPTGMVTARGWDNILAKTSAEGLLAALDAFAQKLRLTSPPEAKTLSEPRLAGIDELSPLNPAARGEGVGADEQGESERSTHRPQPLPE